MAHQQPKAKREIYHCGMMVLSGGECVVCHHRPPRNVPKEQARHNGLCPQCGGPVCCVKKVPHKGDRCFIHSPKAITPGVAGGMATKPRDPANPESAPRPIPLDMAKCLPGALGQRYEAVIADAGLLSIRTEVALSAVRQAELAERLYGGEAGELWGRLGKLASRFRAAQGDMTAAREADDQETLARAMAESQSAIVSILGIIEKGNGYEAAWSELMDHSRQTAELKQMEHGRLKDLRQLMSVEEAMSFAGALIMAVSEVVPDRKMREAVAAKFTSILGENQLWRQQRYIAAFGQRAGVLDEMAGLPDSPAGEPMGAVVEAVGVSNSVGEHE